MLKLLDPETRKNLSIYQQNIAWEGAQSNVLKDGIFLYLECVKFVKNSLKCTFKWVTFIIYKLYLNKVDFKLELKNTLENTCCNPLI